MFTDRTSMTRELDNLIHQQITTLKQDAEIADLELSEFRQRSKQIRALCQSLNQANRVRN